MTLFQKGEEVIFRTTGEHFTVIDILKSSDISYRSEMPYTMTKYRLSDGKWVFQHQIKKIVVSKKTEET